MPIAVLTFGFDPIAHPFGDVAVRWGVLALAGVLIASLLLTWVLARVAELRVDDLAFIAIGAVPGAVVGGRLGYALLHWDYYGSRTGAIADPAVATRVDVERKVRLRKVLEADAEVSAKY